MTEELANSPDPDEKPNTEKPQEEPATPQHKPEDSNYHTESQKELKEKRKRG